MIYLETQTCKCFLKLETPLYFVVNKLGENGTIKSQQGKIYILRPVWVSGVMVTSDWENGLHLQVTLINDVVKMKTLGVQNVFFRCNLNLATWKAKNTNRERFILLLQLRKFYNLHGQNVQFRVHDGTILV